MSKKTITGALSVLTALALLVCCVPAALADKAEQWAPVIEGNYTVEENGAVTSANYYGQIGPGYDGVINTVLYEGFETGDGMTGDYSVSVRMTGTRTLPVDNHIREGIIPWYVDKDNYLVVYVEWADWDRAGEMRCVQVTGRIGGKNINVFDSFSFAYLPGSGWNDFWTDGYALPPDETYELTVEIYEHDEYVELIFILSDANGNTLKDGSVWVEYSDELKQSGKVGLYAFNETVTFTDFSVTAIETEPDPTDPPETEPAGTEAATAPEPEETLTGSGDKTQDGGTPVGVVIGIVAAAVAAVAAVVVIAVRKKKK